MQELDDITLLRQFAADRSEPAFSQLVSRHAGFVHSSALRQVRDPQLAAEITQAVFLILARKAARISDKTILTGWLFKTTRFVALAQVRAEAKRRQHEQETQMHTQLQTEPSSGGNQAWAEVAPLLDQALEHLGETDRQAVLLRFFENKSLAEVGNKLGAGEDTARKRVSRALEKMRKFFANRGVFYTTAIIAAAISANAVQSTPPGPVATIPAIALKGSSVSGSTVALVKEALHLMTIAKIKTAALIGAAAIVLTGSSVVVSRVVAQENQTSKPQTAQQGTASANNQLASHAAGQPDNPPSLSDDEVHEMARLRNELGILRAQEARLRQLSNFLAQPPVTTNPPEITETVWFINSSNELMALPPAFILRPTQFKPLGGGGGGLPVGDSGGEIGEGSLGVGRLAPPAGGNGIMPILARNVTLDQLLAKAHAVDLDRVATPDDAPKIHFDLLMTGPDATKERLQAEIKSRLGYTAHLESLPTDVLVLTTNPTNAPRLHLAAEDAGRSGAAGSGGGGSGRGGGAMNMTQHNSSIAKLINGLNLVVFQLPIIDRTGLTNTYDFDLNVEYAPGTTRGDAVMQAMPAQLGLVLTPSTEPFDQLIVEAEKPPVSSMERETTSALAGRAPKAYAEPTMQDLNRLRAEKITLQADIAQLTNATDKMYKAQSGTNAIVIDEHVWSINNTGELRMLPPAFILRPTQLAGEKRPAKFGVRSKRGIPGPVFGQSREWGGGAATNGEKPIQVLAANITFADLMATAYDVDDYNLVVPTGAPTNGFDLLMTGPDATRTRLQAEIKSQFGYTAHTESLPTNVLLLTVQQPGAAGLQVSQATSRGTSIAWVGLERTYKNVRIPDLVNDLQRSIDMPIFDHTGLTNRFDISLSLASPQSDAIKQSLIEQLGLELKTGVEPIDLLVVEADKSN